MLSVSLFAVIQLDTETASESEYVGGVYSEVMEVVAVAVVPLVLVLDMSVSEEGSMYVLEEVSEGVLARVIVVVPVSMSVEVSAVAL